MIILTKEFFTGDVLEVAPALIGKVIVRITPDGRELRSRITETEAYRGEEDTACHARAGRTPRTRVLYEEGGIVYVYLCYGIHSLLNVVTGPADVPQAALIRSVEGAPGPGRLTALLEIDRTQNGVSLTESGYLYIADDGWRGGYTTAKRVGINYATDYYRDIHWRYVMA